MRLSAEWQDVAEHRGTSAPAWADTQPQPPAAEAPRVLQPRAPKSYTTVLFSEGMFRDRHQPCNFGFEFKLPAVLEVWLKGLDVACYEDRKFIYGSSQFEL